MMFCWRYRFLLSWILSISKKIIRRKCQKTEFHGRLLGFLTAILDCQWDCLTLYSIHDNDHLYHLVILRSIFNWGDNAKEKQAYIKIWALPFKKFSFEFLPLVCWFMYKKNFIPNSIGFCVFAFQSYREILKKYRKKAITMQKNNFSKIWENRF